MTEPKTLEERGAIANFTCESDGARTIEFMLPNRRLLIALTEDPNESHWCLADNRGALTMNSALVKDTSAAALLEFCASLLPDRTLARGRWVAVEERLPERSGWYQVSSYDHKHVLSSEDPYYVSDEYFDAGRGRFSGSVLAWQPLPEPFRPDTGREGND